MKVSFCLFVIFIFSYQLIAQSGNHEIGFNASPLLKQFLRSASFPEDSDHSLLIEYGPYMVNYRHYGQRSNFRLGAGLLVHDNFDRDPGFFQETKRVHLDLRAGFEKMYSISKKWKAYYGLDAVFSHKKVAIKTITDDALPKEIKTAFGGGPVIGVQYFFLEKFSLFTESSFYFLHFQSQNNTEEFINGTPVFIESETKGFQNTLNVPFSLFLNYRF